MENKSQELEEPNAQNLDQARKNATDLYKSYQDKNTQALMRQFDGIYDKLVRQTHDQPQRLPEELFVNDFLPFFAGEKQLEERSDVFSVWVGIAGSPTSEVAIIDRDNNELFRVPPIFDTHFIDPSSRQDTVPSMKIVMNEYEAQRSQLPIVGENYLANALDQKAQEVLQNSGQLSASTAESRWLEIFKRYKKPMPGTDEIPGDTQTTPADPESQLSEDEVIYD